MDDKLITVGKFSNNVEAQMAVDQLSFEGIQGFIADEHISSVYNITGVFGGVKLQVRESDAERARKILE
jgi:hypothetical protein